MESGIKTGFGKGSGIAARAGGIVNELGRTLSAMNAEDLGKLAGRLLEAEQIFVAGAGRSGLMMRAFAMRLMHLGMRAYVVGETVTPGIGSGDLLIVASGSGETRTVVAMAEKAKKLGAAVALLTVTPDSTLGRLADIVATIPASAKEQTGEGAVGVQPMGSLFEQTLLIACDAIVLEAMDALNTDASIMFGRHANLE
ncbi:6-phospho-3-hexuloisomerase [Cohnella thermotolerans]|uniref:6-phospho-3-hexuloisomerase n=1 Tax=Cohnella thermotolerans TaxID=329858 RepID=UPI0004233745|nr:6-phospho-3-hexuloisomerase [Cohnella thermotolerans]